MSNSVQRFVGHCLKCGKKLDGHADIKQRLIEPKPGDASVCFYCATVMMFTDTLGLRLATAEETAELETMPAFRALMRQLRSKRP